MNSVLTRLFRFIETSYSLDDIRTLCLDLDVDYDNLGGETKKAKIRELLLQLGREKRFAELLVRLNETRQKAFPETGLSTDTKTLKALYEALPDFETITTQYRQSPLGDSSSVTVSNSEIKGGYRQLRRLSLATLGGAGLFVITFGIITALLMVFGISIRALGLQEEVLNLLNSLQTPTPSP